MANTYRILSRLLCMAVACVCCWAANIAAQDAPAATVSPVPPATLTPSAQEAVDRVGQLMNAERGDEAALVLRSLIAQSAPNSFDLATAHLCLAMNLLNRNGGINHRPPDWTDAIPSLEHAMNSGFWPKSETLQWKYLLANECAGVGQLEKAERYVREWFAETDQPTSQAYGTYATLLLQRAGDSNNIDRKLVEQALEATNQGLRLGVAPSEWLLFLKATCLERLDRLDEAAETLEFQLSLNPKQQSSWRELFDLYQRTNQGIRAAFTLERARERGVEILGRESSELFGGAKREGIEELKMKTRTHADGALELEIAWRYFALGDIVQAEEYLEAGLAKGVEQTANALLFASYLAFERKDFRKAAELLKRAELLIKDDRQQRDYDGLREVIEAALAKENPDRATVGEPAAAAVTVTNPAAAK
jgi:tetratricopeptide (TPR) repeat protein